ncbi:MAG: hypothetical protein AVDCRST_MAG69-1951, partial [uncultured Solirubrobacteraceae bacterium]
LDVRAVHPDRDDERRRPGGRPRVGHLQHQPADRRRARPGHPLDARQRHPAGPPGGARASTDSARPRRGGGRRLPDRVLRRGRPAGARNAGAHPPAQAPRRGEHRRDRRAGCDRV